MNGRWQRVALGTVTAAALALVFAAYLNPHLAVAVANFVWSCF